MHSQPNTGRQWNGLLLGVIVLLGLFLRLWQIGDKSLWIDEAFSVWVAEQPIPDALAWLARIDQHPPLYYLLLHFWLRMGDDAATVRALSALLSALNVPVLYALGRRLWGPAVGLLAALILALSPFHLHLAQEARMYALLCLCVSLAAWALAVWLTPSPAPPGVRRSPDRVHAWLPPAGYVAATAAALLSHSTAVFFPLAANVFVIGLMWTRHRWPGAELSHGHCEGALCPKQSLPVPAEDCFAPLPDNLPGVGLQRAGLQPGDPRERARSPRGSLHPPSWRDWLLAQLAVLALWLLWLGTFLCQSLAVYHSFWLSAPTLRTLGETLQTFLCAFLPEQIHWSWIIWAGYGALVLAGVAGLRRQPARLAFLAVLFLTPLAGEWLVSLWRPIFYARTLIWATIPLYLLLAVGLLHLRYRPYVLAATAMVVTLSGLSARAYFLYFQKEAWDEAAAYVAARAEEGDLILFNATWTQLPFDFYWREFALPLEERGVPVDLFERGVLEPRMEWEDLSYLRALVRGRRRVWLIYSHDWYTDPQHLIPTALEETLELEGRRRFIGLQVYLYVTPGTSLTPGQSVL